MADTSEFNAGRSEGQADVAVALRKTIDPTDAMHLNVDGTFAYVVHLIAVKEELLRRLAPECYWGTGCVTELRCSSCKEKTP